MSQLIPRFLHAQHLHSAKPREYPDLVTYLEELGFRRLVLGIGGARFKTKPTLILQTFLGSARLLSHISEIREMEVVVAFGQFTSQERGDSQKQQIPRYARNDNLKGLAAW